MRLITATLVFLLIILSSFNVLALTTTNKLFSNYVYTFDTFKVENDIFYIKAVDTTNNDNPVMILQKNSDETFFVHNGTCEETTYYQYCFAGTKLDYVTYGKPIPNSLDWEPAVKVEIYSKKPSVKVTRAFKTEINKDEKTTVSVTIENTGTIDVTNLLLKETIPSNTAFSYGNSDMYSDNNHIFWSKSVLRKNTSIVLSYYLESNNYNPIVLNNGILDYYYNNSNYSYSLPISTIKINDPFSTKGVVDKSKINIEDTFKYTYTIKNEDWNNYMRVDLNIIIPSAIEVIDVPGYLSKSNNITYSFSLSRDESKVISIQLKSSLANNYTITTDAVMTIRDDIINNSNQKNLSVIVPVMTPALKTSGLEFPDTSEFKVTADLTNPSETIYFYDLSGVIQFGASESISISYDKFLPNKKVIIFEDYLKPYQVDKKTSLNLVFKGTYKTSSSQLVNFEKTLRLSIIPSTTDFIIDKTTTKTEVYPGDNLTISVKVRNKAQKIAEVSLYELIPSSFNLTGGLTSKNLTLSSNEQKEFYVYKLNIPQTVTPGSYVLTTNLNYVSENFTKTTNLSIIVKSKVVNNKTEEIKDVKNETVVVEQKQVEKKKNIITTIINFFIGIFR